MRLWSIHPGYLDPVGLVALWREGLLALAVLKGETQGYRNHPQLQRFRKTGDPLRYINAYLAIILMEAESRGYDFDGGKISGCPEYGVMTVTAGQLEFEMRHCASKLRIRSVQYYERMRRLTSIEANPLFTVQPGPVEEWERGTLDSSTVSWPLP